MPPRDAAPDTDTRWQADVAACRQQLAQGSRTFLAASRLLPAAVRDPACVLYAFCRQADDLVDGQQGGGAPLTGPGEAAQAAAAARRAVEVLRDRLDRVYAGCPRPQPADRALATVVQRHAIPAALPLALLDGFVWDAEGRRCATLPQLHDYAARVAGSVGAMMALLMGRRDPGALARACDLGVAMQLSNIARDVGEDARAGRVYLPLDWLAEAGIDADAWLAEPVHSDALGAVVRRVLDEADRLYERVGAGVAALPLACRPGINAARFLYAQIGHEVARRGLDAVNSRARVSSRRKAWVLARSLATPWPSAAELAVPPLPATRHLVEAVTGPEPTYRAPGLVGVLGLIERLERRDRAGYPTPRPVALQAGR